MSYSSDKKVAKVSASPNNETPQPTYVMTVKAL